MAFVRKAGRQFGGLGAAQETVIASQAIGYAQKAIGVGSALTAGGSSSILATTGMSAGGAILGVGALAFGVIGIAIAVISVVYNLVAGNDAKAKAHRAMREAQREQVRDIGMELIRQTYGREIPGWTKWAAPEGGGGSIKTLVGEYYILGSKFYKWSKMKEGTSEYESGRKDLVRWIKEEGLDPTRFVGGANVSESEDLNHLTMFVALPEKILVSKEALTFLGYETSVVDSLDDNFLAVMFDMINSMGKVKTEDQAVAVKKDIEDWLMSRSLDPKIFFQKAAASVPSPVNTSLSLAPEPLLLPGEEAERESLSKFKLPPILLIGLILGSVFIFSSK